jgi:N-acetylglutamate synthase-like GNAT family acetyltransferase
MVITIRPANAADAGAMTQLVHTSTAYGGIYHSVIVTQSVTDEYIEHNTARIAEDEGNLAGFYTIVIPGRGSTAEGELDFMFVADDHQGQGIGRSLISDLRVTAAGLGLTRIHIVSHPPAEAFYRAIGARRVGSIAPRGPVTWTRPHLILDIANRNG